MQVAAALKIECVAPLSVNGDDGQEHVFACLLPQFGEGRGMLINHQHVQAAASAAVAQGYSFSSMLPETHQLPIDPGNYTGCLREWGWSGNPNAVPEWYADAS